ncbi:MAG: outer membrane lipoprotein carrier protein LolA [Oligosphaeraceae bacterium]|nr:outer membrane lipoprotein carrier protein LolA [Oligosphaeraceae bacterium]
MRSLIAALLLLLAAAGQLQADNSVPKSWQEFAARLQPLAGTRTVQAEYRQTRRLQALDFTFEIRGHLYQEQGRRLLWAVNTPLHSVCVFEPESFRQWDAETNQITTLSGNDMPWLKMLFQYQNNWLNGDLAALARDFTIAVLDQHTLQLVPIRQEFTMFFNSLEIRFRTEYDAIENITFREKNGDSMIMEFFNIKNNQPIPAQIWELPPK